MVSRVLPKVETDDGANRKGTAEHDKMIQQYKLTQARRVPNMWCIHSRRTTHNALETMADFLGGYLKMSLGYSGLLLQID